MEKTFKLLVLPAVENIGQVIKKIPFPVKLTKGKLKNLEFVFQENRVQILHAGEDLKEYSFVWLSSTWNSRDLAYAVRLYLERFKIPYTYVEKGTSKLTDHMLFALHGISTPDTLFLGHKEIERSLSQIRYVCGYPLVVKDIKGSRGVNSLLVNSEQELIAKMKQLPAHKKYLFQRYIPNEYDWGVMVANGEVVSAEKSYPKEGEFRNNACNGAKEVFIDPRDIPADIRQMAVKTSVVLGLSWSRSDIIVDKKTQAPYLMEVNRRPGITSETSEVEGAYTFLSSHINQLYK
jgi:glutathione synthase/RimK-type ligase-like ATP-grasp enzyme